MRKDFSQILKHKGISDSWRFSLRSFWRRPFFVGHFFKFRDLFQKTLKKMLLSQKFDLSVVASKWRKMAFLVHATILRKFLLSAIFSRETVAFSAVYWQTNSHFKIFPLQLFFIWIWTCYENWHILQFL